MFYRISIGQNVDIYPSKRLKKSFKANFIPLELTILCLFLHNHGQN
jgi:hypothetical protein